MRLGSSGIHGILVDANELGVEKDALLFDSDDVVCRARLEIARVDTRGVAARRQEEIGGVFAALEKKTVRIARTWVVVGKKQIVGVQFRHKTTSS